MYRHLILLATLVLGLTAASWAAKREVRQKNKEFSHEEMVIVVGDTINFTNDDSVVHNLFSKEFDFNVTQEPGEQTEVVFQEVGSSEVRCVIHPKMKLKLRVVE